MILYLARHGQAAKPSADRPSELTELGRAQTRLVAEAFAQSNPNIAQIWYSPKTRALQTAQIYQEVLGIPAENFIETENLSLDGDVDSLYPTILENQKGNLLLVSHQPLLEELSSLLVTGSDHFPHIAFPTSGIVAFERLSDWKYLRSLDPSQLK